MGRDPKGRTDGLRYGEGSIVERGESFQARWIEHQPTGKTVRRARSFTTRDAAEDCLRDMFRTKRDGRYIPPSEMTVSEVIDKWLMRGAPRWKPWTYRTYQDRAANHIKPYIGDLRAESLSTPRVQHWIDGLIAAKLNPSTIDAAITVLRSSLKEALQIGIINRNPVSGIRPPKVEIKEVPTWTVEHIHAVIREVDRAPMWSALYRVALSTGMRPGELRALQWSDIDLETSALTVRRTLTRDRDGHLVTGATTKTGRSRTLFLPSSALTAVKRWQTAQKVRQLECADWHRTGLVFDRGDGQWVSQATWQRYHQALCTAADVPYITLHALRHTNATVELAAGTNPKIVSERLGHRGIQTTLDRYSHVSVEVQKRAADELDGRMFGGS